jgi:hypothetical protein
MTNGGKNTDILQIHSMLQSQSKSRLVGANAPGIISAMQVIPLQV